MTTNAVVEETRRLARRLPMRRRVRTGAIVAGLMLGLAVGVIPAHATTKQPSFDRDAFLSAVAEVETGHNPRAVGRRGERGLYQFTRSTWRLHTKRAFTDAHVPAVAYQIATEHFQWLHDGLVRNGRQPTPYLMAVAWNGGLGPALSGRMASSTRDYARRVSNLAGVVHPRPVVVTAAKPPPAAPAPTARVVARPAPLVEPVVLNFDLSEPEPVEFVLSAAPPVQPIVEVAATEGVAFSLKPAPAPAASATSATRFFFATIAE